MRSCWVLVVVLGSGCLRDDLVDCGDGQLCPADTQCFALDDGTTGCATPAEVAACDGRAPQAACEVAGVPGTCAPDVCLPASCGNARLDAGEVCDDGNTIAGDGCSVGCTSFETCGNAEVDPVVLVGGVAAPNEQCDEGDRISHDGCSNVCQSETLRWDLLVLGTPAPHMQHAMAYDSARDRVVMFGGALAGGFGILVPRNDTWEFDGEAWSRLPTTIAPSGRFGHVMVYDPVRRRVVMFGGASNGSRFSDTWEWDGTTWRLLAVPMSPAPRSYASAAYDPVRERIVLFGGVTGAGTALSDTWEFDGVTWSQIGTAGAPRARSGHSMAYDPLRGVTVLVGGSSDSVILADTWEYNGVTWTASPAVLPEPLSGQALAFDGTGIVAFGGVNTTYSSDTLRYTGTAWTRPLPLAAFEPPRRALAAMAWDARRRQVVLFGGFEVPTGCTGMMCGTTLADTFTWSGTAWRALTVATPPGRGYAASTFDEHRRCLVVFGGGDALAQTPIAADTWELCGDHWSAGAGTQPPARMHGAMAYDRERRQTVLFGGRNAGGQAIGDTWLWNGSSWTAAAAGPSIRYSSAMAFDPVSRNVILFGGFAPPLYRADTWAWNGTTWTQLTPTTVPGPRARHRMTLDPIRGRITMLGGEVEAVTFADAWEWDGANWIDRTLDVSPPARAYYGIAWNGPRQTHMMFSGAAQTFALFDDVWELSSTTWTQAFAAGGPGVRHGVAMAPSPDGSGVLTFGGGSATTTLADLWRLRWTDDRARELCTIDADTDGDGLAGCDDLDCWAVCAPLCPPGAPCPADAPRCGDAVCTPLETCRLCPGDCSCESVCGDNVCDPSETVASCVGDCG